jgi:hypothetical protein
MSSSSSEGICAGCFAFFFFFLRFISELVLAGDSRVSSASCPGWSSASSSRRANLFLPDAMSNID